MNTSSRLRSVGLVCLFLSSYSNALFATVFLKEAVERRLDTSDLVAEVLVVNREAVADPVHFTLTRAEVVIERLIEQRTAEAQSLQIGDRIWIQTPGGERNGVGVNISGYPRPYMSQHYLAHLNRQPNGAFTVTGFEKGLIPLTPIDRNYSRNRTDGVNGEGNGAFLHWDSSYFPIPYFVDAISMRAHLNFMPAIDLGFRTWGSVGDLKIHFMAMGCSNKGKVENDGLNNILILSSTWPFDTDAVAITRSFYVSGDEAHAGMILDADIILNGVAHQFTTTNQSGYHDVQSIITHEVGHLLGLGHEIDPKDTDAVMYPYASPNELTKRVLKTDDIVGVRQMYDGVTNKIGATSSTAMCQLASTQGSCASATGPFSAGPFAGLNICLQLSLLAMGVYFGRSRTA